MGAIDYWCNAFTPDRRALWDASIAAQGVALKVRRDETDSFTDADTLVARMDELGIDTLLIPTCVLPEDAGPLDFESFAARPEELARLASSHPGRFVGTWSLDPCHAMEGVRRAAEALADPTIVALHIHTHSWDRPLDHRDFYPYYALAAEHGVPVLMQAGSSGGRMASECGKPIGIDRPALYFGDVNFVLSHTGWPWVEEAIAMALKHPNVYIGTATYPPHHWSAELLRFISGAGRGKTLFGTGFPVTGHRHVFEQLGALDLKDEARERLLEGAARSIFKRLDTAD